MFKKPRGRLSLREQRERVNNAHKYVAAMCVNAEKRAEYEERYVKELPPKRDRVKRPVDGRPALPLEKEILANVMKALRADPRVGFVWRQTSGTFQDGNRYIQAGPVGMPDICGILIGTGRFFGIEVKRPGRHPEPHQEQRLEHIRQCGAIAGYCWSIESALALLS